ncbi:hypothetical protein, partial [Escherichia coli]|uniref:hypothetical protein n=1 Tax=Escherichia coli TaxID=562 RepID=UPI001BB2AF32
GGVCNLQLKTVLCQQFLIVVLGKKIPRKREYENCSTQIEKGNCRRECVTLTISMLEAATLYRIM